MRILLTGSSGYLGSRFVSIYKNEFDILGLSRNSETPVDLHHSSAIKKVFEDFRPDAVIHAAAQVGRDFYDADSIINDTERALTSLLNSAIEARIPFIFTSTEAVYGGKESTGMYTETDDLEPRNVYGQAKINSEKMIQSSGLQYLITRGHRYIGYNPDFNKPKQFPDAVNKIMNDEEMILDSTKLFTPVLIDVICETIVHYLGSRNTEQDLINIGVEEPVTFYQLLSDIASRIDKKQLVKPGGSEQGWPRNSSLNTEKSRKLGYPTLSYDETVEKIADSMKTLKPIYKKTSEDDKKTSISLTTLLNKSAKEAFAFTINPENTSKWVRGIVKEQTNESPTKLGTIYRNQDLEGNWAEFEITAFEQDRMFEMTKKDDHHRVRYTFSEINEHSCELEYLVWVEEGELSKRFSEPNLNEILSGLEQALKLEKYSSG